MSDDGSVRTDRLDLDIDGTRLRVLSHHPSVAGLLRSALQESIIDEPCEVGLVVKEPDGPGGFHLVVDRSGLVLARVRTPEEAAAVALAYLETFRPQPAGTHRFRLRTIVREGTAVVAAFPLLMQPAAVERRLERLGYQLLDRFAVDLSSELEVISPPSPRLPESFRANGHMLSLGQNVRATTVLVPTTGPTRPSEAVQVALIASSVIGEPAEATLDVAEKLAASEVLLVDVNDDSGVYDALTD